MLIVLLILVLLLIFGGGGYAGYGHSSYLGGGIGVVGLVLIVLLLAYGLPG